MALMTPLKRPLPAEPPPTFAQLDCDATAACADPPDAEIAVASRPTANRASVTRRPRPMCAPFTVFPPSFGVSIAHREPARARNLTVTWGDCKHSLRYWMLGRGLLRQNAKREVNLLPF